MIDPTENSPRPHNVVDPAAWTLPAGTGVKRRTITTGAAWTIPVVALAASAPLAAASVTNCTVARFTQSPLYVVVKDSTTSITVTTTENGAAVGNVAVTLTLVPLTSTPGSQGGGPAGTPGEAKFSNDEATISVTTNPAGQATVTVTGIAYGDLTITAKATNTACVDPGQTVLLSVRTTADTGGNSWGYGGWGTIGDGSVASRFVPVSPSLPAGSYVSAGSAFDTTYTIDSTGKAWAWGRGLEGQLGNGTFTGRTYAPSQVTAPSGKLFKSISSGGGWPVAAIMTDGTLYGWGEGAWGATGTGITGGNVSVPTQMPGISNVVQVDMNRNAGIALTGGGSVYTWGWSGAGERGDGTVNVLAYAPQVVPNLSDVVSIAAGWYSNFAVTSNGDLYGWGWSAGGTNGSATDTHVPTKILTGVAKVFANYYSAFALMQDGTVKAWGRNAWGQFGNGATQADSPAIRNAFTTLPAGSIVTKIAVGFDQAYALLADGSVYAAGWNGSGESGNGTSAGFNATPVKVILSGSADDVASTAYSGYAPLG